MGPITQAWIKYKRAGNRFDNRVLASLKASLEIRRLIDEASHDAFMELPNVIVFREKISDFLNLHVWLASEVDKPVPAADSLFVAGDKLFAVILESHWMWHLGWRSMWLSPRRGACYAGEDFQRLTKNLARSSTAGCAKHLVSKKMSTKYRCAVHFEVIRAQHFRR